MAEEEVVVVPEVKGVNLTKESVVPVVEVEQEYRTV